MGIRKKIIKRLPIFGRGQAEAAQRSSQAITEPKNNFGPSSTEPVVPETKNPRGERSPKEYIEEVISENKVVLFMKGSPDQPQCGFSANAVGILGGIGRPFTHVDVIADYEVREAIKNFSQWPTLPQIYIGAEFIGGSDILRQMSGDGSLKETIELAYSDEG